MADFSPVTDPNLVNQLEGSFPNGLRPVDDQTSNFLESAQRWSLANSPLGGFARGLRDAWDQAAMMLARGVEAAAPQGSAVQQWATSGRNEIAQLQQNAEKDYVENWRGGKAPTFDIGRILGNIGPAAALTVAAPGVGGGLARSMLMGLATGAASGALQPVDPNDPNYWRTVGQNAAIGGAGGAAFPPLAAGVARLVNPAAVERVAPLLSNGVTPTVGQTLGGAVNRLEQAATSLPIAGDFVKSARARAVNQFNVGAINDVLAPIGEKLEAGKVGRDAIVEMGNKVRDAYSAAVPAAGGNVDAQLLLDLQNLHHMSGFMPPDRAGQFQNLMRRTVLDKISPSGAMTGEAFKEAESDLGKFASNYLYNHNATSDERQLGGAVRELQSTLREWLGRINPSAGSDLAAANNAYARMLRVENAAVRAGEEPGVFSPAQLLASVKKLTPQRQFARGEGLMQPYAEAGKTVLGSTVPDSGTPFRSLATILAGSALGHGVSPEAAMGAAGAGAGLAGLYSPPVQWLLSRMMGSRPAMAAPIANAIRAAGPAMSAAGPYVLPPLGTFSP